MLEVLRLQRDRYRARIAELEVQLQQSSKDCALARQEVAQLRADNVKLFERVKFAQSFHSSQPQQPGADVEALERKYSAAYDKQLDPFLAFSAAEQRRRLVSGLSAAERAAVQGSRLLLAHRWMRLVALGYALALHALMFITLFHFAHVRHE
jgi:homeobox protein cut-like